MANESHEVVNEEKSIVPENDRFEWSLGAGWCALYQHVKNGSATSEEINDRIAKTLTKYLRERSGVPGFQNMMNVIVAPPGFSLSESYVALDRIVEGESGHRHSKVAAKEAKSLLNWNLGSGGTMDPHGLSHQFAANVCIALVKHYFIDRVCPQLIADGKFADSAQAHEWQKQIESDIRPHIDKIADQLIQKTDGRGLRAPRRTAPKLSTSDLLAVELV